VAKAESRVASAIAELEQAKQQLGAEGNDNAAVRSALAALETARIDLAETRIFAPTGGGITNLKIQKGYYANAGSPIMTFVSGEDVWVQANFRENSLARIDPGDPVEIVLDIAPGRIFKGRVFSRGFAVVGENDAALGQVANVKSETGWLRDAQRFPVIINFDDDSARGLRAVGGQADVQVYAGDHAILNALGRLWIRLMSGLSFVY
jgi:multidrug resistance efflux pump